MSPGTIRVLRRAGYAIGLVFAGFLLWSVIVGPAIVLLLSPR
jgi:tetrahydromethanopterin S-methyltransferase subunit F